MANWTRLLPFWFIRWYASRNCQIIRIGDRSYVTAYRDVLIDITDRLAVGKPDYMIDLEDRDE